MPRFSSLICTVVSSALLWSLAALSNAEQVSVRVVDRSGEPLGGVVVVGVTKTPMHLVEPAVAQVNQEDLKFIPEILVVQSGTEVSFPNRDDVMHHVYSFSPAKSFELPLYKRELPPPVAFDQSGVAVIGCNIHDHMVARILVVDSPYFGTTDIDGRVSLEVDPRAVQGWVAWHPGWGEFGEEARDFDAATDFEWKVPYGSAGRLKQGALAWNEDY